jgi:hypothetical protein
MTALKKFYDQALALFIKNPSAWILGALLNSAAYASYTLGRTLTKLWEGRRAPLRGAIGGGRTRQSKLGYMLLPSR